MNNTAHRATDQMSREDVEELYARNQYRFLALTNQDIDENTQGSIVMILDFLGTDGEAMLDRMANLDSRSRAHLVNRLHKVTGLGLQRIVTSVRRWARGNAAYPVQNFGETAPSILWNGEVRGDI